MKTKRQYMRIGLAALLASLYGSTLTAATVNGTATATVIAPLLLVAGVAMDFGSIAAGVGGGTVVLNTAGSRASVTGDINAIGGAPGGTAGAFTIQGAALTAYTMGIAGGTLTDAGGLNPMTLGTFTNTAGALTGAADAFTVGATMTVPGSQPAGAYSTGNPGGAAYVVTANYN